MDTHVSKEATPRRPIKGSVEDIRPPQPVEKTGDVDKKYLRIFLLSGAVGVLLGFGFSFLKPAQSAAPATAAEIGEVYGHAIVLQAREGDTLESAALAVFPNTLVEERVREDGLSDEAKALELARYQAEWVRLARTLTGTTGSTLAPGEFFAVPARSDDPNAVGAEWVLREIQERTEEAVKAAAGDG